MAGGLSRHLQTWRGLSSDKTILDTVRGFTFTFTSKPVQTAVPGQLIRKPSKIAIINDLLATLLDKGVLEETVFQTGGFISNIFLREKRNGGHRLILNLKPLNQFVEYHHFKMDTLQSAMELITNNCHMASLDLSDAYNTVSVAICHRKYLQFAFLDKCYRFTCLANGISSAPRIFMKLLKIPLSHLREHWGHFNRLH